MVDIKDKYLEKIYEAMECINEPYELVYNKELIVVDHQQIQFEDKEKSAFIIVKEIDGKLESFIVSLNDKDQSIRTILDDTYNYSICLDNEIPVVTRENLNTNELIQLFYSASKENQPRSYMHFYQMLGDSSLEVEYQYDVTLHDHCLDAYIDNLNMHYPSSISLNEYKKFLNLFRIKNRTSFHKTENGLTYGKATITLPNFYTFLGFREYDYETLKSMIREMGLLTRIPDDLSTMYTKSNSLANTLELTAREYQRQVLRR